MKKNKKHRFVHPDPELKSKPINKGIEKEGIRGPKKEESFTRVDLRRVILTIAFFSIVVLAFYFLNQKIDFLGKFIEILGL